MSPPNANDAGWLRWPPARPGRRRRRGRAEAARPLPRLVVEAGGAAAHGQRQDLDGAARGAGMGALRPADDHLSGERPCTHRATRRPGARRAAAHPRLLEKRRQARISAASNDVPWSAAFISWDIESAGVSRDLFCPDARHTIYVERMVERARRPGAAFIPRHLDERAPQVGDLICAVARRRRHDPGKPESRTRTLRHRGRGPAGRSARHRRQRGRLGHPQRLSTGRVGFLSPISGPAVLHRDREQTALGRRQCGFTIRTTTSSSAPARPAA